MHEAARAVADSIAASGGTVTRVAHLGGHLEVEFTAGVTHDVLAALATADLGTHPWEARATTGERGVVHLLAGKPERTRTAVRLPVPLRDLVQDEVERTGTQPGQLLMAELDRTEADLEEILAAPRRRAGLTPGAPKRRRDGHKVQVWISVGTNELARIDLCAARWCSGNRSALATRMFEHRYRSAATHD